MNKTQITNSVTCYYKQVKAVMLARVVVNVLLYWT